MTVVVYLLAALIGGAIGYGARVVVRRLRGRRRTAAVAGPGGDVAADAATALVVAGVLSSEEGRLVRDQVRNDHTGSAPAAQGSAATTGADSPVGDDDPPTSSPTAAQLDASATAFRHLVQRACDADRRRRFADAPAARLTVDQALAAAEVADRFERLAHEAAYREALKHRAAEEDLRSALDELHALAVHRRS